MRNSITYLLMRSTEDHMEYEFNPILFVQLNNLGLNFLRAINKSFKSWVDLPNRKDAKRCEIMRKDCNSTIVQIKIQMQ